MTTAREECLDTAKHLITQDRAETYGDISDVAQIVSDLLAALPLTGTPADYPLTQIVVKLARLSQNPLHSDSWTDIAGYAGLGYELAAELSDADAKHQMMLEHLAEKLNAAGGINIHIPDPQNCPGLVTTPVSAPVSARS